MTDDFLKPPSGGVWLAFIISLTLFGGQFLGPVLQNVAAWVAILCAAITLYIIFRWLGRVAGYFVREFVEGYRGGYEDAKRRREENASN